MTILKRLFLNTRTERAVFFIAAFLAAAVAVGVYKPGLNGPFAFDDLPNILQRTEVQIDKLSVDNLVHAGDDPEGAIRRPISMASFALTYYFARFDPFAYKLVNLIIHIACGALLYLLTFRLLGFVQDRAVEKPFSTNGLRWLSLAVGGLWVVHPLNLTVVLYIVQRMTSLSALFVLAGLLAYAVGRKRIADGRPGGFVLIGFSLPLATLLAILSKENGALLPAFAILIEVVLIRFTTPPATSKKFLWFWWVVVAGPVILGLVAAITHPQTLLALGGYDGRDFTLSERLLTEPRIIWLYLRLILIPDIRDMGLYHDDLAVSHGLLDPPTTVLAIAGIIVLFGAALLSLRRQPLVTFGILWFFLGHSLESTVIPLELAHDHRNYLPMFGVLLPLVWYLALPYRKLMDQPILRHALVLLYFVLLSAATFARAHWWQDEWTLVNQDVLNHPNSARAHTSLAVTLYQLGMQQDAHRQFVQAANLHPTDASTIVRAVQHYYLWKGDVPEDQLRELDYRLQHYPMHPVVLWTYEPFIADTRKNHELQRKIIDIYERSATRPDAHLSAVWRARVQYVIALEDFSAQRYRKAAARLTRALEIEGEPDSYLLACQTYMELKNKSRVRDLLQEMKGKNEHLSERQRRRVAEIEHWLAGA